MTKIQNNLLADEAKTPTGLRWYVVLTQPRKEAYALQNLSNQEMTTFLPKTVKRVRKSRRWVNQLEPLFPRYIFVQFDLWRDRWRSVLGTFGVSNMIMANGRPLPAPEGMVDRLIEASDKSGAVDFSSHLTVGASVRVKSGPFTDFTGRLEKLDASGRVAVLLEVMGAKRYVNMSNQDILPSPENPKLQV